jgi:hypothetical protein
MKNKVGFYSPMIHIKSYLITNLNFSKLFFQVNSGLNSLKNWLQNIFGNFFRPGVGPVGPQAPPQQHPQFQTAPGGGQPPVTTPNNANTPPTGEKYIL